MPQREQQQQYGQPASGNSGEAVRAQRAHVDTTGIPAFDEILGGGLPRGSLAILVGSPGSGKTTLAMQIAFAAARAQRRALILTALSEPTNKLLTHLRSFAFFDESVVGDAAQFFSLQQALTEGLDATADAIVEMARAGQSDIVVIDGFRGVRGATNDLQVVRQFLYEVGAKLGVLGITLLVTSESEPRDSEFFAEATTADVIVGLYSIVEGMRRYNALEVIKVRGAQQLPGLHGMRITPDGVEVFPRFEAIVAADDARLRQGGSVVADNAQLDSVTEAGAGLEGRARFELPALDVMLGGGLTRATGTVLTGSPGTGKTLLALTYALAGARTGEPTLYVSLRETRQQLMRKADQFAMGAAFRAALAPAGGLTFQEWAPVELDLDIFASRLFMEVDRIGARRLVIDSIAEIERITVRGTNAGRMDDYLAAMLTALRQRKVTSLFVKETSALITESIAVASDAASILAENVILTQHMSHHARLRRIIIVLKMRFSAHDTALREFRITSPQGIDVLSLEESAAGEAERSMPWQGGQKPQEQSAHAPGRQAGGTHPAG